MVFVIRQRRIADPMLDLSLFTGRQFSGSLVANTIAMFALVGNAVFLTQYLQSVLGFTPLVAALWSLAPSVLVAGAAVVAGALGRAVDRAYVMGGGFALAAGGFLVIDPGDAAVVGRGGADRRHRAQRRAGDGDDAGHRDRHGRHRTGAGRVGVRGAGDLE